VTLLTLDLSSQIGWTAGHPADRSFQFGTFSLTSTGSDIGLFLEEFVSFLEGKIKSNDISLCVFEAPILPTQARLMTLRKLYSLCGVTELICRRLNVECAEANLMNVKKFVCNNGHAKKQQMFDTIRSMGYDVETFDAADAVGTRLFAISQRYPDAAHMLNLDLGVLGRTGRAETQRNAT